MTARQDMLELLKKGDWDARELSQELHIPERDVYSHLEHVEKSTKGEFKFHIIPSHCKKCGFTFTDRKRVRKPSKCPKCKQSQLEPPRFEIIEKKHRGEK